MLLHLGTGLGEAIQVHGITMGICHPDHIPAFGCPSAEPTQLHWGSQTLSGYLESTPQLRGRRQEWSCLGSWKRESSWGLMC